MLAMLLRPTASLPRVSPALAALMMLFIGPAVSKASVFSSSNSKAEAANDAYQSRDFTQARDLYARLLSDNTTDETKERLSYGLGAACQQLKEYDRAIEGFSKSLESRDPTLQSLSHQGLGTALYDQGAKSLQQQPEYAEKAWSDSLRHFEAAAKLNPDRKVTENLDFVKKQLAELKKQIQQEKGKQKKKGDKNKDKGNGDKDKGPKGDESEEGDDQGEKGDPKDGQKQDKDGDQKDGDQKDGKQQDGSSGDQKDQKQSQSGKDGDEKDGQKGEAMEQKDDTKGPEGKIQAAEKGEGSSQQNKDQQTAQMMAEEEKKQDQTGYSRNEARNLLRTYNDMMAAQRPNRREHNVTKDW